MVTDFNLCEQLPDLLPIQTGFDPQLIYASLYHCFFEAVVTELLSKIITISTGSQLHVSLTDF